ncbi:uncharacterized protein [Cicer arietinum]|uniref:uncharacterized protein isoform X3 n=2 Tax=Cicer arietinum TaxID=3827 RepID=UPI003CC5B20A
MSAENKKLKPKSDDSELFLNNANHCNWKILKNESGAGANAASSRADMTLAANDPLSEIVWSPEKDDVFAKSKAIASATSDNAAITDAPSVHPISDSDVKLDYKAGESNIERASNLPDDQDGNPTKDWEKNTGDKAGTETDKLSTISGQVGRRPSYNILIQSDEPKPTIMERNTSPRRPSNEGIDIDTGKKEAGTTDDDLHISFEPKIEYKDLGASGTNLTSSTRNFLEKPESGAENDLRNVETETACAVTCGVIVNETKNESQDNEMTLLCDKVLSVSHYPCSSRIHMTKDKGKEKSLSDGDANVRLPMDNDSHSSVESRNSAGFFSTGKKRRSIQQQLIIGSKRVKKNIEETSGSKPCTKQDSSFKNWISSMVKGLSQSIQHNSDTLPLSLANPYHRHARPDEKLISCKMNQDTVPKNTGFKSIFQSMYRPSLKNVRTRMLHQEEESNEDSEPSKMIHGINATPITCFAANNSLAEQRFQSNKFEASPARYDAGPSEPTIAPLNFFNCQESIKNNPVENENCSNLSLSKDKEEMASNSSSSRQNANNTDNVDSNAPSERKEAQNICHRRDNLGSLWITRFASKSTPPLTISDRLNERSFHCKIEETGEQPANDTKISIGLKEDKGNNDHKSHYLFNNISSSPGFTNSEQMASIFARRFIAIKHIMPTNNEGSARPQPDEADCILSGGTIHDGIDHETDQNINLKRKSNDIITFKIECSASCKSTSKENKLRDKPITSPFRMAEKNISHVPEGIFDAVKNLQLSRSEILKWITVHGSISQLNGFFLRLRLGKWEEGHGRTGYHVAYINETERHSLEQHMTKSLSVKVRGMKCMVESHYISNHDFLEEEIMEWWSTTSETGVEIPSEQDLIAKFKKKQMLGL